MSNKNNLDIPDSELCTYVFETFSDDEIGKATEIIENMPAYKTALIIAIKAHRGQFDKSGKPYILHPLNVSFSVDTEDEKILALLHDIVEDTDHTLDDVRDWGFGHLTEALDCLTRKPETETYKDFILRVCENKLAISVKIADMKHNLSRIDGLPENEKGLKDRYLKWLPFLEEQLTQMTSFDEQRKQ